MENGSARMENELRAFFTSALSERAGAYLHERARIGFTVAHARGHEAYVFYRRAGRNVFERCDDPAADVHFLVPRRTMRQLLAAGADPAAGIGSMGVLVIEHLFHFDPARKIRFRVATGYLSLWTRGYFSILKAGGPEVASYLARWGYGSLASLKELLHRLRG